MESEPICVGGPAEWLCETCVEHKANRCSFSTAPSPDKKIINGGIAMSEKHTPEQDCKKALEQIWDTIQERCGEFQTPTRLQWVEVVDDILTLCEDALNKTEVEEKNDE